MSFKHPTERALIYKQKGSNNWYISYYNHLNQRKQITAKTDNLDVAKKKLEEILLVQKLIKDGVLDLRDKKELKSVKYCCLQVIKELEQTKPFKQVYTAYIRHLKLIQDVYQDLPIKDLDRHELKKLFKEPLSETQLRVRKTALKHLFEYAQDKKYIDFSPDLPRGTIKGQQSIRGTITEDQLNKLISRFADKQSKTNKKVVLNNLFLLMVAVEVLYRTGMRLGELKNLKMKDLIINGELRKGNKIKAFLQINQSKTNRRLIMLDLKALNELLKLIKVREGTEHHSPESYIFSFDNKVKDFSGILQRDREDNIEWYRENGLENFVLYELRHSFITRKIREKKALVFIAQHCGTSVKMIEKHYLDYIVSENYHNIYTDDDNQSILYTPDN